MNPDSINPLENLRERTAHAVRRAREIDRPVLVSVSMAIAAPEDLFGLFERAGTDAMDRVFWQSPAGSMVGVGTAWSSSANGADRFRALSSASEALLQDAMIPGSPHAGPRFFGAFAFAPDVDPEGPWHGFPAARLVLPRLLVARESGRTTLTASVVVGAGSDPEEHGLMEDLSWLRDASASAPASDADRTEGRWCEVTSIPSEDEWRRSVSSVLAEIERGRIEKLVLARATGLRAESAFDGAAILRYLCRAYPACIQFCIATREGTFLGATPEPLIRRAGSTISTAAIAGSAARGVSGEADRSIRAGLLGSAKEAHEHEVVVRWVRSALAPLCEDLQIAPAPHVLELANVRHLATEIRGRLRHALPLLELVERLHPTPAVAGLPRAAALAEIRRREALDRGWYAGPIGWMDAAGNGEFAVAIRSALVRGREALLYAGAGIVAGSDPDRELAETRLKLAPLLSAMTGVREAEPTECCSS